MENVRYQVEGTGDKNLLRGLDRLKEDGRFGFENEIRAFARSVLPTLSALSGQAPSTNREGGSLSRGGAKEGQPVGRFHLQK